VAGAGRPLLEMKTAELLVAYSGTFLEVILIAVLFWRSANRRFPVFVLCRLFSLSAEAILIPLIHNHTVYFYGYWSGEALNTVLSFLALREAFRTVFLRLYSSFWIRYLFSATAILLLAAALLRAMAHSRDQIEPVLAGIIAAEVGVRFLQLGLFGLFLLLTRLFRNLWHKEAFGILTGFAISGAGNLIVFLLRSEFGTKFDSLVRITPPIAYLIAEVVWLATFAIKPAGQSTSAGVPLASPDQVLADVKRNTESAKEILKR
jgi:hypothetical protein